MNFWILLCLMFDCGAMGPYPIAGHVSGMPAQKSSTLIGEDPSQTSDPDAGTDGDTPIDSGPDATIQTRRGTRVDRVYRD